MSNAEMIRYWNEAAASAWVANQERLDAQLAPLGARLRERARIEPGESVVDVGCGCGGTTLELADAVGTAGRVLAVDVSAPMLARARERARAAGLADRIVWHHGDAQTALLGEGGSDLVFSRFGLMFFDDPAAAFANLHRALRPGGRLAFVCWQQREKNVWMMAPAMAAARHIELGPPPDPDAPGPFAFGDAARVRGILARAGFGDVAVEAVEEPLRLAGETLEETVELFLQVGPVGAALREASPSAALRERVVDAVRNAIEAFRTPRGFEAPAGAWIFEARRSRAQPA